ncbi:DUF4352 domain-containing protein [Longispora urticae]
MNGRKLVTVIASAWVCAVLIACGSGSEKSKEAPFVPSTGGATTAPAPAASPVKLTAKATAFKPSVLHDGGDFTSVEVTVTNDSSENVSVNPLSFTITATDGAKHNTTLGEDERQLDTLNLASGEHVTGVITAEGKFQPARVTFNVNFGKAVTANVQ